jgi:5-methyltetrahydropteroyltriglutamate--homocysteine methyltransferase
MPLFATTIAGSLPKPAWLAEPNRLWAPWRLAGRELEDAKRDATLLALKLQEDCSIDVVTDGEQSRQHFVHGFLEFVEGIDFARKVEIGIRADRYKAMVPTVTSALRLTGRVHAREARLARAHTRRKLKFTLPGPMTIVDTIADAHYGDRVQMAMAFADLLNVEARALEADGVDVIQFDEPAFNVYMREVKDWGIEALHRAIAGNSRVPIGLLKLLDGKDVQVGAIDVASDEIETPEQVAGVLVEAARHLAKERIVAGTNCGMAPMRWDIAFGKLKALGQGAALARQRFERP